MTTLFEEEVAVVKAPKRTEGEMLDLLRARHVKPGNGGAGEYAFLTHVRNAAGFSANRTFDAIAMSLWPSRGLTLHGFEVKCSRSDWLRELKDPAKAEAAAAVVDRFSIVAADAGIVAEGELPPTWGLLVARGSTLRCVKEAPVLPDADPKRPIDRSFLVALLRAGGAVPQAEAEEVLRARVEARDQAEKAWQAQVDGFEEQIAELRETIQEFERAAGVPLLGWRAKDAAEIGAALRSVLDGEERAERARDQLRDVQAQLRRAADDLDRYVTPRLSASTSDRSEPAAEPPKPKAEDTE